MYSKSDGFTLIEVLVALAIFAVVSLGLVKVREENILNAARLEEKTIAHWVAMNKMVELQALPSWPNIGKQDSTEDMANRRWDIKTEVSKTTMNDLRKVEIRVGMKNEKFGKDMQVATVLTGYIANKSL